MGRSRAVPQPADEDPTQSRSKRKRTASNVENLESATTGQGPNEGKKALYHCNYCNKDISGKIRIKCVLCPDFDLCLECFSVGAEVTPHKSNHPYRVMHKELSFSNLWHRTYFRVWHMFRVAVDLEIFDNSHSVELRSCRSLQRLRHGGVF